MDATHSMCDRRTLNARKGSRPPSRQRVSPVTPSPFPTLDAEPSSSIPSFTPTVLSGIPTADATAMVALHVAVPVVRNVNVVLRVGISSPQLEHDVRELQLKLRQAETAAEAVAHDAQRKLLDKDAEIRRARRFNRMWRAKYMQLKGEVTSVEQAEEEDEEEEGDEVGGEEEGSEEEADNEDDEDMDDEDGLEEDAAPEQKIYVGRQRRQRTAKQVWKLIWDLKPACAASVLVLAAYRASALPHILSQKTMQRHVNSLRRKTVEETRTFLLENQLAPEKWCKWMLQTHVSLAKVDRLRSVLCFDDVPVEVEGETIDTKVALRMHKDFTKPSFKLVPSHYRLQKCICELLEGETAISKVGTVDGASVRGATLSVRKSIVKLIFEAEDRGNLTRDGHYASNSPLLGTMEGVLKHNIAILVAGDGFSGKGLKVRGKIVRMGCSLLSQTGWNCSPDDWLDFASWSGGESWAQIDFMMDDLEEELRAIEEAGGAVTDVHGNVRHISLLVGGDKPWILDFCGKMNMNATNPFVYCTCNQEQAKDFSFDPADHNWVEADRAARLAHVCPEWRWQGKVWKTFTCEMEGCTLGENQTNVVTQQSYDELMERITELPAKAQAKEVTRIARMHYCFKPGRTAAFRWLRILPDPMHAIMNILEPIIRNGIWQPLTYDKVNVREDVKEVKDLALEVINNACRVHRIQIQFYNDENGMPRVNGNAAKQIMASGILDVWIRAVSPVLRLSLPQKQTPPIRPDALQAQGEGAPPSKRRKKTISDAMQAALARASTSASVEHPLPPDSEHHEERRVEDQLEILLATSLAELTDVWNFLTDKTRDPQDEPARNAWRQEFFVLAKKLGQTATKLVGQCTYTHDLAYGVWHGSIIIGAYLRASMEGFEHGNKDMGAIYRNQVVVGGKAGREGGKRHESVQALELRRATTLARLEDCLVNKSSHATLAAESDEPLKKRIDTKEAQALLHTLKSELELIDLCSPCAFNEVKQTLNDLKH